MLADRGVEKGGTRCQGVFLGGVDCYGWRKGEPGGWREMLGKILKEVRMKVKIVESTE